MRGSGGGASAALHDVGEGRGDHIPDRVSATCVAGGEVCAQLRSEVASTKVFTSHKLFLFLCTCAGVRLGIGSFFFGLYTSLVAFETSWGDGTTIWRSPSEISKVLSVNRHVQTLQTCMLTKMTRYA